MQMQTWLQILTAVAVAVYRWDFFFVVFQTPIELVHIVTDINECQESKHNCNAVSECVNTQGSFKCECPEVFEGDGTMGGTGCTGL